MPDELGRQDGCLQAAILTTDAIGDPKHDALTIMDNESPILVFRISRDGEQFWIHQI